MHFNTLTFLAALVVAASGAPTTSLRRQNVCPLQVLPSIAVLPTADSSARWNVFGNPKGIVQAGELGWFVTKNGPGNNEKFIAKVGAAANLFSFQAFGGSQQVGISGSKLLASANVGAATFKVDCGGGCNTFATGNTRAADGCTFELTDGTNGVGQCISFEGENTGVQLQSCEAGNSGQTFTIFSTN
ncbi:hypothetical protein R3P38DRAFT_2598125 [Favolaschia claudopus]|uniref:Ricin B lectin domain-containing protein n=1 Tax=Favolaschia claudopus TaxID=2862362 RepID=A0AAW0E3U3_9AGAR